ncbi:hypothetical protein [Pseudogracilibacillus auburnensis]|uniref:hypothetical protein n=1 Tax=Pseudogracilibacillus auburnensis TaxID=1494959 RepID=UPI001A95C05B|nr:hypothetical protein [Pseudogracilibacillus auburnensis]MBO1005964.1 hypothetical protein [Pseudogracilibacillus auburnensis]
MPKHGEVFKGKVACEDCQNEYTWIYQYLQDGNISPFIIPEKGENEAALIYLGNKQSRCHCPKCGYRNFYDIIPY